MARGVPKLPPLVERKLYKTGQTRGADDDQVFQNRVGRNSTVLIPLSHLDACRVPADDSAEYERGFIALVPPAWYFSPEGGDEALDGMSLRIGRNALVFYQRRSEWDAFNPESKKWTPATARTGDLGGQYVARVAATTSADGARINRGFTTTSMKGAGIRVYEYAASETIKQCRIQLEAVMWLCPDAVEVMEQSGMTRQDVMTRREYALAQAHKGGLLDSQRLVKHRITNEDGEAVCPLCLEPLSASGFGSRMRQAAGREVFDLTVTDNSLFHIDELRVGTLGHRPYNLGWGHHHCNVVTKDAGIHPTIDWMRAVLERNQASAQEL